MDNKTLSIVSYITIIGWVIAYFVGKDKADDLLKINPHIRFKVKSHLAHKNINYSVLNDNNFNQIIIIGKHQNRRS